MPSAAPSDPVDGIVVLEVSLDGENGFELPALIGCIRAGAAALDQMPFRNSAVTGMQHAVHVSMIGMRLADELEAEGRRVLAERQRFYRARAKADRKAKR